MIKCLIKSVKTNNVYQIIENVCDITFGANYANICYDYKYYTQINLNDYYINCVKRR